VNVTAILLGLASAVLFAVGSAMEQSTTKLEKPSRTLDPRLILHLLRRPRWVLGLVPTAGGVVLQALALRTGALALIEPLLLAGVFLAVPLSAAFSRQRPQRRDFVVVALGVVGLAAFLAAADPQSGVSEAPTVAWWPVLVAVPVLFAACLLLAWRLTDASRGIVLGIGTGLLYGFDVSLLKTIMVQLSGGVGVVFANWHVYALMVGGLVALILNQNAFQNGRIAAPLTTIVLVDPIVSVLIGVTVYQETLSLHGARLAVGVCAAVLIVTALWLARRAR
jgi:hypothetical protein